MKSQLAIPFPSQTSFRREDFVVTECTRAAWEWINRWPDWPAHGLVLCGPAASGKSHLAAIWAEKSHAEYVTPARLAETDFTWVRANVTWVLEDAERIRDETFLFHFLNTNRETGNNVLLTMNTPHPTRVYALPDLASRITALPAATLKAPDDEALRAVLRKLFSDRQLRVGEEVLSYLLARMERAYTAAQSLAEQLDQAALAEKRALTLPFVRNVLERMNAPPLPLETA